MGRSGLAEIDPPGRAAPVVYSPARLRAIREALEKTTRWLTDKQTYRTRSAAYHHAGVLCDALTTTYKDLRVKRKTWEDPDGFHWAIRKE